MTPIEKAENALNARIGRLQAALQDAESESTRQFLFQSVIVSIGVGEALTGYVRAIGQYAEGRHGRLKQTHDTLTLEHAALLKSAHALLEEFKANPTNRAIRKEIERAQTRMAGVQKNLRRGANTLQRELAPSMAMIDKLAESVRRLAEADRSEALKRTIKLIVEHMRALYLAQSSLPAKVIIDAVQWEKSAGTEIDSATDSHEAYARTGYQVMLCLEVMTMALSHTPPRAADEAINRATESVAARVKEITTRFISK